MTLGKGENVDGYARARFLPLRIVFGGRHTIGLGPGESRRDSGGFFVPPLRAPQARNIAAGVRLEVRRRIRETVRWAREGERPSAGEDIRKPVKARGERSESVGTRAPGVTWAKRERDLSLRA